MSGGAEWTQRFVMVSQNILQVPFIVEQSDLIAVLPRSFALLFNKHCKINVFKTPVHLPLYTIDLIHAVSNDIDPARAWFVRAILAAGQKVRQEDQELNRGGGPVRSKPSKRRTLNRR